MPFKLELTFSFRLSLLAALDLGSTFFTALDFELAATFVLCLAILAEALVTLFSGLFTAYWLGLISGTAPLVTFFIALANKRASFSYLTCLTTKDFFCCSVPFFCFRSSRHFSNFSLLETSGLEAFSFFVSSKQGKIQCRVL